MTATSERVNTLVQHIEDPPTAIITMPANMCICCAIGGVGQANPGQASHRGRGHNMSLFAQLGSLLVPLLVCGGGKRPPSIILSRSCWSAGRRCLLNQACFVANNPPVCPQSIPHQWSCYFGLVAFIAAALTLKYPVQSFM